MIDNIRTNFLKDLAMVHLLMPKYFQQVQVMLLSARNTKITSFILRKMQRLT